MRSARQRGIQARQRLLAAAERLLLRDGMAAVSIRDVTAEAGLSLAMVNYHFGSRDTLMVAVLRRRLEELNAARVRRLEALGALQPCGVERPSVAAVLRVFLTETLGYRWAGGDVRDLLAATRGATAEEMQRVRRGILGLSGPSAARVFEALSATLAGIPVETLWWRWRVAMGAVEAAIGLSPVDPAGLSAQVSRLVEILVPLLSAGEAGGLGMEEWSGTPENHREPPLPLCRRGAAGALLDPLHMSP